jgi:hypothetical protein
MYAESCTGPCQVPLPAIEQIRQSLLDCLRNVIGGDSLAAEYMLLHLLSQVSSWPLQVNRENGVFPVWGLLAIFHSIFALLV